MNLILNSSLIPWILTYLLLKKYITNLKVVASGLQKALMTTTNQQQQKIVGTTAVRNLKQFESTCELKRMYVLNEFRRLGLGQKLLDTAIDFAKSVGYSRMVLDSSKTLYGARALYLKKGFVDIPRYNDNYRADVFMERKLSSSIC